MGNGAVYLISLASCTWRLSPIMMKKILLIAVCLSTLVSCSSGPADELILFDFEADAELDKINWKCFTLFSLSYEHVTHGQNSLRMELYPSNWPGWTPKIEVKDWHRYKAIAFDIFNPEEKVLAVAVRIDDKVDYPDYTDRYNKRFNLKPGMNHMHIPLDALATSGTNRALDLKKIYRFFVFMGQPERKYVLYLDYVRLIS
jgi:hypothetical protein